MGTWRWNKHRSPLDACMCKGSFEKLGKSSLKFCFAPGFYTPGDGDMNRLCSRLAHGIRKKGVGGGKKSQCLAPRLGEKNSGRENTVKSLAINVSVKDATQVSLK